MITIFNPRKQQSKTLQTTKKIIELEVEIRKKNVIICVLNIILNPKYINLNIFIYLQYNFYLLEHESINHEISLQSTQQIYSLSIKSVLALTLELLLYLSTIPFYILGII